MQRDRLFEILYILLESRAITASELAAHLEVSQRTIYRDLEVLSSAGVPVYAQKGRGGGIRLLPGFVLDKALLTNDEKAEIVTSLRAVDAVLPQASTAALGKLSALFGNTAAECVDWIEVNFTAWSPPNRGEELFSTLKQAILNKSKLCFSYAAVDGKMGTRTVQPLKLGFRSQAWYLYAYCENRKAERFFKLARIRNLKVLEEHFERAAPLRVFTSNLYPNEPLYDVKLRFSSTMAWHVLEEFETFERTGSGDYLVELRCPGGNWLFAYVATFGASCEILEPEFLRKGFIAIAHEVLSIYEQSDAVEKLKPAKKKS